jgi:glycosyltransferase involved in cell wall biosynthesis
VRIGFNTQLLGRAAGYRQTGVSRYVERLLASLPAALRPGDELVPLGSGDGVAADPRRRAAWEQGVLPALAARRRLDLLHGPVNVVPLAAPCPLVVTVHDLAYLRLPEVVPERRRRYFTGLTRLSVRRAQRVLAVSESTKRDLVELLDVDEDRVAVTPLAADERFRPLSSEGLSQFRAAAALDRPYVLYLGTIEPRKNLPTLLRAFESIAADVPHLLVIVGPDGWLTESFYETLRRMRHSERVRRVGFVPAGDLAAWYGAADLFVFPSRYEGFGLPVLEAMACGTPVVTSNVSSLPEVAGDAALCVDPADEAALAEAIRRVLSDATLAADLRTRGLARAGSFSWSRTATQTVEAYYRVRGDGR